jgi:hypothetical protein
MKRLVFAAGAMIAVLMLAGCATERSAYYGRHHPAPPDSLAFMTTGDIIKLSKSRVGDGVIIDMIHSSGSRFVLHTDDVVALADSGVSDSVITAMLRTGNDRGDQRTVRRYAAYPTWYAGVWYPFWGPWYSSMYYDYWPGYYRRPYYSGFVGGGPRPGGNRGGGRHR